MVDAEKQRRLRWAADAWLAAHPEPQGWRSRSTWSPSAAAGWSGWPRLSEEVPPASNSARVAPTQDALYADIDLALSWSERDLPERERTKHVHRLHPVPRQVHPAARRGPARRGTSGPGGACSTRSPARARRSSRRSRAGSTRPASTSRRSTACSMRRQDARATTRSCWSRSCATRCALDAGEATPAGATPLRRDAGSRRRPRAELLGFRALIGELRARGRAARRARARRAFGAADDALRPRLPARRRSSSRTGATSTGASAGRSSAPRNSSAATRSTRSRG